MCSQQLSQAADKEEEATEEESVDHDPYSAVMATLTREVLSLVVVCFLRS